MSNRLTLRQLRYFVAVASDLSFRRAAERLGVSQPPLTRQIQELEDIVGLALLERDTQRVALTTAGQEFLEEARNLLQRADQLVQGTRSRNARHKPAFATTLTLTPRQNRRFAAVLDALFGPGEYSLSTGLRSPDIAKALRDGSLAAALVSQPVDLAACHRNPAFSDPLMAALPASHPAARRREVQLGELTGLPIFWWARRFNPAYYDTLREVLNQAGLKPRFITVELAQLLTLERIAGGEGFTLINQSRERTRLPGLVYKPLKGAEALTIQVDFAWNDQLAEKLARKLIRALPDAMGTKPRN